MRPIGFNLQVDGIHITIWFHLNVPPTDTDESAMDIAVQGAAVNHEGRQLDGGGGGVADPGGPGDVAPHAPQRSGTRHTTRQIEPICARGKATGNESV